MKQKLRLTITKVLVQTTSGPKFSGFEPDLPSTSEIDNAAIAKPIDACEVESPLDLDLIAHRCLHAYEDSKTATDGEN
jgi:hypothetical protein